jgi:6-phosphogluconolactonase
MLAKNWERPMNRNAFVSVILTTFALGAVSLLSGSACAQSSSGDAHRSPASSNYYFAYVGTYTGTTSKGIYGYRFDPKTGQFTSLGVMAEAANPSFVATDADHRFLYASTERGDGPSSPATRQGFLSSYAIDPGTGALTFLNKVSAGGTSTAHLVVDGTAHALFAANYGSGTVNSFALKPDGSIGALTGTDQHIGSSVNTRRQEGPHPHAVVLSPDHHYLFVPDLGLDKVFSYRIDTMKGTFQPNDPPFVSVNAGLGPRHLTFGVEAKFAYAVCEMGSSVVAFSYDRLKGSLKPIQTISTLPSDFHGENNSAEIQADRSGRFLYASNRGNDTITLFGIDPQKGTLAKVQVMPTGGKTPRNFVIDPTGRYLIVANQDSDKITIFDIDRQTGKLTPTRQVLDVPSPVAILFIPAK